MVGVGEGQRDGSETESTGSSSAPNHIPGNLMASIGRLQQQALRWYIYM